MDPILRGVAIYLFLLLVIRLTGKRAIAQITTFDFVLLLVIGEATQQALLSDDFSIVNALILILVLISIDLLFAFGKRFSPRFEKIVEGMPVILVERGRPIEEHLKKTRVDESEILESARMSQGLERMDQIKYAVLERSGQISIIPWQ